MLQTPPSNAENYLARWAKKTGGKSSFNFTTEPPGTVTCEFQVAGCDYVGKGSSSQKKDAATLACWNFCKWLIKHGKIVASELNECHDEVSCIF